MEEVGLIRERIPREIVFFGNQGVSIACLSPSVNECVFLVKMVMRLSTGSSPWEAVLWVWGQAFTGKSSAICQRYVRRRPRAWFGRFFRVCGVE